MIIPTPVRAAEHLHTKRCMASAVICAVENARDAEGFSDHDFALWLQDANPRHDAHVYLTEGIATCICNEDGQNPCFASCCGFGAVDGVA